MANAAPSFIFRKTDKPLKDYDMGDAYFGEKRPFQYLTFYVRLIPPRGAHVTRHACYASRFMFYALASLFLAVSLDSVARSSADIRSPQSQKPIDYVVAVVNDRAITLSALENELIIGQIRESSDKVNRARLLKNLIEQNLLLQEAERWGIPLARWKDKVNAEVEDIKSKYDSESLFFHELDESGLEYKDLEEWIKSRLILNELIVRRFHSKIDKEAIEQGAIQNFKQNQFFQFQYIIVFSSPEDSLDRQAQTKQIAEKIYARLQAGAAFDDIQQSYESAPNVKVEYEPQIIAADTKLGRTIAKLGNNELSHPILTPEGYLICKLMDETSPYWKTDEAAIEDIKITMIQKEERTLVDAWLKPQWETGDIRILDPELAHIHTTEYQPEP